MQALVRNFREIELLLLRERVAIYPVGQVLYNGG